ncbi:hypothetical protein CCB80_15180 [Armatimonadetes bacterium Uphvl-Ar1]|nr:hypothetical protein CCB80_15180 [Armatimonadetes bacterium Uphvl-Ar1]
MAERHAVVDGYLGGGWVEVDSVLAGLELVEQVKGLNQLMIHLRWEEKDLAGISRAASVAEGLVEGVVDEDVLGAWKAVCYNRAAFFWRGWRDEDVEISVESELDSRRFALLNLKLAEQLDKPAVAKGRAEWLVGAFDWAAGELGEAVLRFDRAAELVEDEREVLMMQAYVGAVRGEDIEVVLDQLDGMEEGEFYSGQVRSAMAVYGTG